MTEEEKQVGKDRLVAAALEFTQAERHLRQTQIELEQNRTNPDVRVWLELTENYHAAVARMSRAERALHAYADAIEDCRKTRGFRPYIHTLPLFVIKAGNGLG